MSLQTSKKPAPRIPKDLPEVGHIDKGSIASSFSTPETFQIEPRVSTKDANWSLSVKHRDGYVCQRCGGEGVHAHHLYPRVARYSHLRHVLANGLTMCADCHGWAHKNMPECREWWAGCSEPFYAVWIKQGEVK